MMRTAAILVVLAVVEAMALADPRSSVYGTERASLGSFFRGIELGGPSPTTIPASDAFTVELETTNARLDGVVVTFADAAPAPPCAQLVKELANAWGPPIEHWGGSLWRSRARDRAAMFEKTSAPGCTLHVYRLVPPQRWLNASKQSSIPIWAIGAPVTQLERALAPLQPAERDAEVYGPSIGWEDRSIDGERMSLAAYYDKRGTVIGIEVDLELDPDLEAWHRLNAVFGAPGPAYVRDDNQRWTWRGAPGIVLDNWVGTGVAAPVGRSRPPQDLHPARPNGLHDTIVFGVKPPPP